MNRTQWWLRGMLRIAVLLLASGTGTDESDPLLAPTGTPRERTVSVYNEGVTLLCDKHYATAQEKFEQTLALDEALA